MQSQRTGPSRGPFCLGFPRGVWGKPTATIGMVAMYCDGPSVHHERTTATAVSDGRARTSHLPRWLVPVLGVAWVAWSLVRLVFGLGPSGGLGGLSGTTGGLDVGWDPFSAPDAPNGPGGPSTGAGGAGAGSGPQGGGGGGRGGGGRGGGGGNGGNGGGGNGGNGNGGNGGGGNGGNGGDGGGGDGGDDDFGPPEGHDSWLDFLDFVTWTAAKGMLDVGPGIDVLEMGPEIGKTLDKVGKRQSKQRDALDVARNPDKPGAGEGL